MYVSIIGPDLVVVEFCSQIPTNPAIEKRCTKDELQLLTRCLVSVVGELTELVPVSSVTCNLSVPDFPSHPVGEHDLRYIHQDRTQVEVAW